MPSYNFPCYEDIKKLKSGKKSKTYSFTASFGVDPKTGRRRQVRRGGFPNKKIAYEAYLKVINDFNQDRNTEESVTDTMIFKEFVDDYFIPYYKRTRKVKPQTFPSRFSIIQHYYGAFNKRPINQITTLEITKWQNQLLEQRAHEGHKTDNYARMIRGLLNMIFKYAKKNQVITVNPTLDCDNIPKERPKINFLTIEEFERFCATFYLDNPTEYMAYVTINFLFLSGLRIGEAIALNWRDLDLDKGEVEVNKSITYYNKHHFVIGDPKTYKSRRTVSIDRDTVGLLEKWKAYQQTLVQTEYVFSYDGIPTNKLTIGKILRRHLELAQVKRITVHGLRHSHAAMLIHMGVSALQIQKRLGHADVKTTLSYYGHLYPSSDKSLANKLTGIVQRKTSEINLSPNYHGNQYIKLRPTDDLDKSTNSPS